MKKFIAILMVSAMILASLALAACSNTGDDTNTDGGDQSAAEEAALKFGFGLTTSVSASNATADAKGAGQITTTVAAVLVDEDGKIVKAFIDCADNKANYEADGKAVATASFKTKYELGKDYGMTNPNYGGTATKEWFEQADAFCSVLVGKTSDEVKALVADNYKGTDDVINAGCTIYVSDLATAVENAIANATESKATKNDTLKIGVLTSQTNTDATADADGSSKLETTFFAAAVDAEGKVTAASSDCVEVTFTFDNTGKSTFDATKKVLSKKEKGDNYGMTNPTYGGTATLEWYEQAAAFDATCIGKTAAEIANLMGADYKGTADVQAAGCTIYVSGLVGAAKKIG